MPGLTDTSDSDARSARRASVLPEGASEPASQFGPAELSKPQDIQYHLFVDRVHDYAVFLMDATGRITHWGEGAQRMKGYLPEEAVGLHLRDLYPPDGAEDGSADEHLAAAAEKGEYTGEGTRMIRTGETFPARVVITALRREGELIGFSKVTQDLSERKRAEKRLREALRAAEAANIEKSRFLATMSHEIRTPINAVLGYADLLGIGIAGPLTELQQKYIDRLRSSGQHLLSLIEDVLDFSRVEAGRIHLDNSIGSAVKIIESAAALHGPAAEACQLELRVDCEVSATYWGDEVRVRQILGNLIGNAIKFTPRGGVIRISCGTGEPEGELELARCSRYTWLRVEDTGIGIPADRLAMVFEPFIQLDGGLTRVHEGSGLGLAISMRLARVMGGNLIVESREGAGSTFTLWLPAEEPEQPLADPEKQVIGGSLTPLGHLLGEASNRIIRALGARLRTEPAMSRARPHTRGELENHLPTLLTDVAQALVALEDGGRAAEESIRDGREVQALLARRHALQRRRLGWTEGELKREHDILREEVEAAIREAGGTLSEDDVLDATKIVRRLLDRAADEALEAFREAPKEDLSEVSP